RGVELLGAEGGQRGELGRAGGGVDTGLAEQRGAEPDGDGERARTAAERGGVAVVRGQAAGGELGDGGGPRLHQALELRGRGAGDEVEGGDGAVALLPRRDGDAGLVRKGHGDGGGAEARDEVARRRGGGAAVVEEEGRGGGAGRDAADAGGAGG